MRVWCMLLSALACGAAACVPTDDALPLGSAQFTITARYAERSLETSDGWSLYVERYVIGFRTMTIVNLKDSEQCSYRGRGADANIIVDGTVGSVVQAFNGIKAGPCPDVGMRLDIPNDYTRVGQGTTAADLVDLVTAPAHTVVTVKATKGSRTKRVLLRFDPTSTTAAFANCRDAIRGAKIEPEGRDVIFVAFDASAFFRDALAPANLRFDPFDASDTDDDGQITMAELDQPGNVPGSYTLPNGASPRTLGQWVRAQFQASLHYGDGGACDGLDAGTNLDQ